MFKSKLLKMKEIRLFYKYIKHDSMHKNKRIKTII